MTDTSASSSANEPVGPLADRLAALAHLFAVPIRDQAILTTAGVSFSQEAIPSEDDLAADHYRILSHDVMPDAGVFLEDDGMLGGSLAQHVYAWMTAQGFAPDDTTRSTGHMVNELGFMAHLLRTGAPDEAAAFWHRHAAGWMPLVMLHLQRSESAWFEALGSGLAKALGEIVALAPSTYDASNLIPASLAGADLDLNEGRVGLARIGAFLAVPARSGLVLSRSRLSQLGRAFRLPTGFGSRARIVEGLLRSGAQYDGWTAICDALIEECDTTRASWSSAPDAEQWKRQWFERLAFTRATLERMRDAEDDENIGDHSSDS